MGILTTMEQRSRLENPAVPISSPNILQALGEEHDTPAGVSINSDKALGITAFWAGVRMISQTVAALPLECYERLENGRKLKRDHAVHQLLHVRPNDWMTPYTFKELRMAHLLTWGNSYAEIEWGVNGQPIALWPLDPGQTEPFKRNGQKWYATTIGNTRLILAPDRVLHVPGLGFDGLVGYNPVKLHRDSLGLSAAANEYGARFFGNSGRPSGYIKHPGKPAWDERTQLREEWNQVHTGLSKAQRTAVLWGGMEWQPISMPPEDAQFLQTREFQIEEVARMLNINPILLQHHSKATTWGSGVAQFLIAYAKFTITPWLERDEDAMNYDLFKPNERDKYYVKYNVYALLRGDMEMQARILEIKRRNGIINADEWRELDEENPLPDGQGKYYLVPLNMAPVDQVISGAQESLSAPQRVLPEKTEKRSARLRDRLRKAHRAAFQDGASRFVKRDVEAVTKAINKAVTTEDPRGYMDRWIEEFYPGQQRTIYRVMLPIIATLAEVVATEAADEVAATLSPEDIENFTQGYTETFAMRETSSSIGQLRTLMQESPAETLQESMLTRVGEWSEKRPLKVANREIVQVASGAARFAWGTVGLGAVWRANPDACPICQDMDGKRIGGKDYFLKAGESVSPEGVMALVADNNIGGPPLHNGCTCTLEHG